MLQVDVDVMVKERPMRTADLECEWQIAPGDKGRPSLVSLVPGGSLTFEHRNIARQARQVSFTLHWGMVLMVLWSCREARRCQ